MRKLTLRRKYKCVIFTFSCLAITYMYSPFILYCIFTYPPHIIKLIGQEPLRRSQREKLIGEQHWQLFNLENRFYQRNCRLQGSGCPLNFTWLTVLANNKYVIPAVVLGHGLKKFSCCHKMLALVTVGVSASSRKVLESVGFSVSQVKHLDCKTLHIMKGKHVRKSGILGTHTRLHAWKLINYSRVVYLDPDFLLMSNFDIFLTIKSSKSLMAAYCARPGVIDPCFNAGLLVIRPSIKVYNDLMMLWDKFYKWRCVDDQVLLYSYFAKRYQWDPLPYSYNIRRIIYFPMKAYHFACCKYKKPWELNIPEKPIILQKDNNLLLSIDGIMKLWWHEFYEAIDVYDLNWWWSNYVNKHNNRIST